MVFGLLIIVILGFFAIQPNRSSYKGLFPDSLLENKASQQVFNSITKKDSDNDGLKDWEEELWGTDPNNPDTDGDGTIDGEEINLGRNPVVAGPDDIIDNEVIIQEKTNKETSVSDSVTNTDIFAQKFFSEYLSLKKSNKLIDDTNKDLLINSAVESILNIDFDEQYRASDLNITNDISTEVLKKYGNDFAKILQLRSKDLPQDELIVFERMLKDENKEDATYLKNSAIVYNITAKDLTNIKIPNSLVSVHLDIVNSYMAISSALEDISFALDDSVRGLNGFGIYINTKNAQIEFFKKIKNYFIQNKIIFNINETGYLWHTI